MSFTQGYTSQSKEYRYDMRYLETGGPNNPPVAQVVANVNKGNAPLTVSFDASGSKDSDKNDLVWGYGWNFGDGKVEGSVVTVEHTFTAPGKYTVQLYARDYAGLWDTASVTIEVLKTSSAVRRKNSSEMSGIVSCKRTNSSYFTIDGRYVVPHRSISTGVYLQNSDGVLKPFFSTGASESVAK